jgi:hypothetical protein
MAIKRSFLLAILIMAATAGVALATHTSSGLATLATWRGTMDRADLSALARELGAMHQMDRSDLFVVRASLAAGGTTDWHGHTGPSIVIVTEGALVGALEVSQAIPSGGCSVATYGKSEAFFHTERAHTFVNRSATTTEFLVAYFVPGGSPVTHPPTPAC